MFVRSMGPNFGVCVSQTVVGRETNFQLVEGPKSANFSTTPAKTIFHILPSVRSTRVIQIQHQECDRQQLVGNHGYHNATFGLRFLNYTNIDRRDDRFRVATPQMYWTEEVEFYLVYSSTNSGLDTRRCFPCALLCSSFDMKGRLIVRADF